MADKKLDKHRHDNEVYFNYIKNLDGLYDSASDIIFNYPIYTGAVNIARFLSHYEAYKQVVDKSGYIADVGTHKGASLMFYAKLVKLFEPYNFTEVHGFDWFQGMEVGPKDNQSRQGLYKGDYERLRDLISLQGYDDFTHIHKLDLTKELPAFFERNPHMRFKLIYLDCAIANVLEHAMTEFWPRLVNGGILLMDHYGHPISPQESNIMDRFIGDRVVHQFPLTRLPTGYVIK